MLKLFTAAEARGGLLRRIPLDDMAIPDSMKERIQAVFGAPLSPAEAVNRILADVRARGDAALQDWSSRLDGQAAGVTFRVPESEIEAALNALDPLTLDALALAVERIRRFHQSQPVTSWITQSMGGTLGQLVRPIRRVGIYVPSGSAPLPIRL